MTSCEKPKGKEQEGFVAPRITEEGDYKLQVHGVPIHFPFEPYKLQVDFMGKVVEAFKTGSHGLLESPTGTGKTLSLLCAALGYTEFSHTSLDELEKQDIGIDSKIRPTVIYASRTHSQLGQVIQELKRTRYNDVQISVLGARDNLCVNPSLRGQTGTSLREQCGQLVARSMCKYHVNLQRQSEMQTVTAKLEIMDIEEMNTYGKKKQLCPYYLNRERSQDANIVFMPYNFLVDPRTRSGLTINWNNACVIIDEAHNIQKACDESASISWSTVDMARCAEECQQLALKLMNESEDQLAANVTYIKGVVEGMVVLVDNMELRTRPGGVKGKGREYEGSKLIGMFEELQVGPKFALEFNDIYEQLRSGDYDLEYMRGFRKLLDVLTRVFVSENQGDNVSRAEQSFKCYVEEEDNSPRNPAIRSMDLNDPSAFLGPSKPRTFHFWCFSPGVTLTDIVDLGVRSVILTSGTLSPLPSFAFQMRQPFPVQLENPHVVDMPLQVWLGVIGKGVTGKTLNSSYSNRNNVEYLTEVGNTIANFARLVPDGLLVFFPSYAAMNNTLSQWKGNSNLWTRILKHKQVFVEPRGVVEMKKVVEDYEKAIEEGKGAMFLAVCRGKASEGIDFANGKARAVILTGLPFPPIYDAKVMLKKKFLDVQPPINGTKLTGQEWYTQEAIRAINQALGRVIRHKDDYGAMILLDNRFASSRNSTPLSKWLHPSFHVCKSFGQANMELARFFLSAQKCDRLKPRSREDHVVVYEDSCGFPISSKPVEGSSSAPTSWVASRGRATVPGLAQPHLKIGFEVPSQARCDQGSKAARARTSRPANQQSIASLASATLQAPGEKAAKRAPPSGGGSFADEWMLQHTAAPAAAERVKRKRSGAALAMSRIRAQEHAKNKMLASQVPASEGGEEGASQLRKQGSIRAEAQGTPAGVAAESNPLGGGSVSAKDKAKVLSSHRESAVQFVQRCKATLPTEAYKGVKKLIRSLQSTRKPAERTLIYTKLHAQLSKDSSNVLVSDFKQYIENPDERAMWSTASS